MKMKKKVIITLIVVIILIILGIGGYFIWQNWMSKSREYQVTSINEYAYFVVKEKDKYGVIDSKGNTVIPANYDEVQIPNPTQAVFLVMQGETKSVLNEKAEAIFTNYQKVSSLRLKNVSTDLIYEKQVLTYEENGKLGLMNIEGKQLTSAIYEEIDTLPYKEGELLVKQDGKYGVINQNGAIMVKPNYDQIKADGYYDGEKGYHEDGYLVSQKTDEGYRYGYQTFSGEELLPTEFNELERIGDIGNNQNIFLIAAKNGQYGLFQNGEANLANEYQSITYDTNTEMLIVQKGKKYGVYTPEGKNIIPIEYPQIDSNGDYFYIKQDTGEVKVYDKQGKETTINPNLVILNATAEEGKIKIHILTENNTTKFNLYREEEKLTKQDYTYIEQLYGTNFVAANASGKLGIIDTQGNAKTEMKYDSVQKIAEANMTQATITSTKQTDFYDQSGNLVGTLKEPSLKTEKIESVQNTDKTEKAESVEQEYIIAQNQEQTLYFDLNGTAKTNTQVYPNHALIATQKAGKWGFSTPEGKQIIECQYDQVTELNQYGFAGIKQGDKWGIINQEGKILLEPTYSLPGQLNPQFIGKYYQVQYGYGQSYYTNS